MYAANVNGQRLNFAVSGKLWNRSLIMRDEETGSDWSHLLGKCMDGKLKGTQLAVIAADMVTWRAWRKRHSGTTVLNMRRTHRDYTKDFYRNPDRFVLGWLVQRQPYHATFATLKQTPLMNLTFGETPLVITFDTASTSARAYAREVEGRRLRFVEGDEPDQMRDRETGSIWKRTTGEAIAGPLKGKLLTAHPGIPSFTRAWTTFHPKSLEVAPGSRWIDR